MEAGVGESVATLAGIVAEGRGEAVGQDTALPPLAGVLPAIALAVRGPGVPATLISGGGGGVGSSAAPTGVRAAGTGLLGSVARPPQAAKSARASPRTRYGRSLSNGLRSLMLSAIRQVRGSSRNG